LVSRGGQVPLNAAAFRAGPNERTMRPWQRTNANARPRPSSNSRLEVSKSAVLNSLPSLSSRRSYDHAIREFIDWYCSEPRLTFNRIVVTRYRMYLEQAHYASSTINLRLTAVRRLAYEAAAAGLLSPDLAAGIRRVKGAKKRGVRIGSWLTAEQSKNLLAAIELKSLRDKGSVAKS